MGGGADRLRLRVDRARDAWRTNTTRSPARKRRRRPWPLSANWLAEAARMGARCVRQRRSVGGDVGGRALRVLRPGGAGGRLRRAPFIRRRGRRSDPPPSASGGRGPIDGLAAASPGAGPAPIDPPPPGECRPPPLAAGAGAPTTRTSRREGARRRRRPPVGTAGAAIAVDVIVRPAALRGLGLQWGGLQRLRWVRELRLQL